MDWNTIAILITIIGCFLGLAGWLGCRDKKIGSDGERRGMVTTKLDAILGITDRMVKVETRIDGLETRQDKTEFKLDEHIDSHSKAM